jgi:rhomboid protease GluP
MKPTPLPVDVDAFIDQLRLLTPRTWVTPTLVALNVLVWLLNLADGLSPWLPSAPQLLAWGGNHGPATLQQPWRLVTACFLHAGILHLAFNMWALWETGRLAERFYGNVPMLLIYLVSGVAGSLASLFFSARNGLSVGASGAIFGVVGCLLAALFTQSQQIPTALLGSLRTSMLSFVGYSLFMGLVAGFVDNAAHLGGLAAGAAMGVVLVEKFDTDAYRQRAVARTLLALAMAGAILGGCWLVRRAL